MASQVVTDRVNRLIAETITKFRWNPEVSDDGYMMAVPPQGGSTYLFGVQLSPGMERPERKRQGRHVLAVWLAGPGADTGKGQEIMLLDPSGAPSVPLLSIKQEGWVDDETVADLRDSVTIQKVRLELAVEAFLRLSLIHI